MNLKDRIALVTGASSGIGEVAETIRTAGGECWVSAADVTVERELVELFQRASSHWGGLDVLVNAAGIGRRDR